MSVLFTQLEYITASYFHSSLSIAANVCFGIIFIACGYVMSVMHCYCSIHWLKASSQMESINVYCVNHSVWLLHSGHPSHFPVKQPVPTQLIADFVVHCAATSYRHTSWHSSNNSMVFSSFQPLKQTHNNFASNENKKLWIHKKITIGRLDFLVIQWNFIVLAEPPEITLEWKENADLPRDLLPYVLTVGLHDLKVTQKCQQSSGGIIFKWLQTTPTDGKTP